MRYTKLMYANKYAARLQSSLMNLMRAPDSCPERDIAPLVAGPFRNSKHRGSVDAQKLTRF
nr:MAG TPA: hypothetical protein [Bacteriophage sp.]